MVKSRYSILLLALLSINAFSPRLFSAARGGPEVHWFTGNPNFKRTVTWASGFIGVAAAGLGVLALCKSSSARTVGTKCVAGAILTAGAGSVARLWKNRSIRLPKIPGRLYFANWIPKAADDRNDLLGDEQSPAGVVGAAGGVSIVNALIRENLVRRGFGVIDLTPILERIRGEKTALLATITSIKELLAEGHKETDVLARWQTIQGGAAIDDLNNIDLTRCSRVNMDDVRGRFAGRRISLVNFIGAQPNPNKFLGVEFLNYGSDEINNRYFDLVEKYLYLRALEQVVSERDLALKAAIVEVMRAQHIVLPAAQPTQPSLWSRFPASCGRGFSRLFRRSEAASTE